MQKLGFQLQTTEQQCAQLNHQLNQNKGPITKAPSATPSASVPAEPTAAPDKQLLVEASNLRRSVESLAFRLAEMGEIGAIYVTDGNSKLLQKYCRLTCC